MGSGMTCPTCGSTAGKVIESRPGSAWRKRRIACANCRANYTTYTDECGRVATVGSGMSRGIVAVEKHKAAHG